jgi:hypothetical protein
MMKTILFVTVLLAMMGCGGDNETAAPADAAVDYGDACVSAQGNCGCVLEETYNLVTHETTTAVVCPDR